MPVRIQSDLPQPWQAHSLSPQQVRTISWPLANRYLARTGRQSALPGQSLFRLLEGGMVLLPHRSWHPVFPPCCATQPASYPDALTRIDLSGNRSIRSRYALRAPCQSPDLLRSCAARSFSWKSSIGVGVTRSWGVGDGVSFSSGVGEGLNRSSGVTVTVGMTVLPELMSASVVVAVWPGSLAWGASSPIRQPASPQNTCKRRIRPDLMLQAAGQSVRT